MRRFIVRLRSGKLRKRTILRPRLPIFFQQRQNCEGNILLGRHGVLIQAFEHPCFVLGLHRMQNLDRIDGFIFLAVDQRVMRRVT